LLCLKEQKAATAAASPAHLGSKSAKEEREIVTMIQMNAGISEDAPDTAILVVEKGTLEPVFIEILEAPDSDAYYEGGIGALPPGEWEIWVSFGVAHILACTPLKTSKELLSFTVSNSSHFPTLNSLSP
jgi:hypothetical protein